MQLNAQSILPLIQLPFVGLVLLNLENQFPLLELFPHKSLLLDHGHCEYRNSGGFRVGLLRAGRLMQHVLEVDSMRSPERFDWGFPETYPS